MVALDLFRVRDEFLVDAKERGLVENGKQRRPFLEVDVDASVREQPRGYPHGGSRWLGCERIAPLDVQERLWIKVGAGLAILLHLSFEGT